MERVANAVFMCVWCLVCPFGCFILIVVYPYVLLAPGTTFADLGIMAWTPLVPLVMVPLLIRMDRHASDSPLPSARIVSKNR